MIIPEIKKMSTVEHLQAMEELWDALCHEEFFKDSVGLWQGADIVMPKFAKYEYRNTKQIQMTKTQCSKIIIH
ncbi:MAG: hypothetical protein M5U24_09385 [Candidatus Kuenenia sp.]|uniref:hypothetical protein n=1 Tax=Candidatus Kuenenia sp. TaxID=2499824 RepID=UPI0022C6CA38|nr:hypothetical protein [Candidatus Kuenenia sp.]MCZ7622682.1 hypothetical protein [Candidatus Kuenenia sp.]